MKTNKINNIDIFTHQANENYKKHIRTQSKQALEIIDRTVNWPALIRPIEKALDKERSNEPAGRPRFSVLTIVKCLLLEYIYDLSDPRLEEEIADRRSFQIFLDLNSGDSIPDETTIWRYREFITNLKLDIALFEAFNKQLERRNILLERVTLVDATIKQAQATPSSKRDKDATFTKKRGKTFYGYKGHVGVDHGSGFIHSVEFTPANVHDSDKFDSLVHGKEKSVYADKGYASKKRKSELEANGAFCGILEKGYRNKPLTHEQVAKNKQLSKIRNGVERPFAFMKRVLNYDRCRYFNLERNRFQFFMNALVYNIRKLITYEVAPA